MISNSLIFCLMLFVYLIASFFPSTPSFILLATLISIWGLFTLINLNKQSTIFNYTFPFSLLSVFFIYIIFSYPYWEDNFDSKDLIAEILFLWIIPFIIVSNIRYSKSFEFALIKSLRYFFVASTFLILVIGLFVGVDFDRSFFFSFQSFDLHKNAVAVIYEVQYCYALYTGIQQKKKLGTLLIILFGFLSLLIIGSKTALLLMLLITFGLFNRWLFILGGVLVAYGILHIMVFDVDLESVFRTAYFRRLLWEQAWAEIISTKTHLYLGNGPGTFEYHGEEYGLQGIHGTHNLFLRYFHNYGLFGISIFTSLYIWLFRRTGFWTTPAGLSFWIFVTHSMFDVGWTKSSGFFISLFLGLALSRK